MRPFGPAMAWRQWMPSTRPLRPDPPGHPAPKIDGFEIVCELIRRESQVPIVMLHRLRREEEEQIKGFDLEVDDYVTKPFSIPILLWKIRAVLRRSGGEPGPIACGTGGWNWTWTPGNAALAGCFST